MSRITDTSMISAINAISGDTLQSDGSHDPLDQEFGQIGFDSLARQELLGRLERAHDVRIDPSLELTDAWTPRELLAAIDAQGEASA